MTDPICLECGAGGFADASCPNCGSKNVSAPPVWWLRCEKRGHDTFVEGGSWCCDDCKKTEDVKR